MPALRQAVRTIALVSALATIGFMAWVADWTTKASVLAFMIGLIAWCVLPYAGVALAGRKAGGSISGTLAVLATAIVVPGFAAVVYIDAFFIHLDAQGGLVFLFVPFVQWAALAVGAVAAHLLDRRAAVQCLRRVDG